MENITIRYGKEEDLVGARDLVVELAVFEKEPNAVAADLDDYRQSYLDGDFEFIVATADEKIIGLAIYYMTFSTWKGKMLYLEDFVITNSYRKKGIGQLIWDQLIEIAKEKKCALLKWQVLDWNRAALEFYHKNKAIIEKNWWNGKIILMPERYQ